MIKKLFFAILLSFMFFCSEGQNNFFWSHTYNESWDIDNFVYDTQYSLTLSDTPFDLWFNPDGTILYVLAGGKVYRYDLDTAWDVSIYTSTDIYTITPSEDVAQGIYISSDGVRMYIVGSYSDLVKQYTLDPPFSIASPSFVDSFDVSNETIFPTDIFFKPDGTQMYIVDEQDIMTYLLGTAWSVSTSSLGSVEYGTSSESLADIHFKFDGTSMYLTNLYNTERIEEHELSITWLAAISSTPKEIELNGTSNSGIFISPDGRKLFTISYNIDAYIYKYIIP